MLCPEYPVYGVKATYGATRSACYYVLHMLLRAILLVMLCPEYWCYVGYAYVWCYVLCGLLRVLRVLRHSLYISCYALVVLYSALERHRALWGDRPYPCYG